nr:hypothetical protein [uncultured Pseudomonas sp.]
MASVECKLCGNQAELRLSHLIPKFIGKWLKETSATGYLRDSRNINKRSQDILKEKWLCHDCEQLFSGWEKSFAEIIFKPHMNNPSTRCNYSSWMSKFCTSMSWRSLSYMTWGNDEEPVVKAHKAEWAATEAALKDYLLGRTKTLGHYEQHVIPVEGVAEVKGNASPRLSRYLMRSIHTDLIASKSTRMIYTKIPGFIILGFVTVPYSGAMRSSRIALGDGYISPRKYHADVKLFNYINEKADEIGRSYDGMSEKQKAGIEQLIKDNPEKVLNSGTFKAFMQDHAIFGDKSFSKSKSSD